MKRILGLCILLFFCSTLVEAGYNPDNIPPKELGKGSRAFSYEYNEIGTSGTFIRFFGIQPVTGAGTNTGRIIGTDTTLPQEIYDYNGGTPTINLKNIKDFKIDGFSQIVTEDILAVNGHGTNTILHTPTVIGGTQSGSTALTDDFIIGTETVTKQKIRWLADVTDYIQTQLDSKEDVSNKGVANGYASLDVNGKVVEESIAGLNTVRGNLGDLIHGQLNLILEGDIVGTSSYNAGTKQGTQTIKLSAVAGSKPDISEDGNVIGTASAKIDFNASDFDVTQVGGTSTIGLSAIQRGTSTPVADYVIKGNSNGKLDEAWLKQVYGSMYRTTAYSIAATDTWYTLGLDGTSTASGIVYGTATMQVSPQGTYECFYKVYFLGSGGAAKGVGRLVVNGSTEIPGSFGIATVEGYSNENMAAMSNVIVALNGSDTVALQVGSGVVGGGNEIDVFDDTTLPNPTTRIYAIMTLHRIGN